MGYDVIGVCIAGYLINFSFKFAACFSNFIVLLYFADLNYSLCVSIGPNSDCRPVATSYFVA